MPSHTQAARVADGSIDDDGGITGPAFFDHVRRLRRPVINSPKGQTMPVPPDLARRPVVNPAPHCWALVSRRDEPRAAVKATIEALTSDVGTSTTGPRRRNAFLYAQVFPRCGRCRRT
ncbi:hypothetical protein GCM10010191_70330 [Actinomadura vinacea]|uniref:Uncharacterized protein n=1 Tax=Actinomadura vinacea TaxID=115336 RepID=A0ABN3JY41_9ACTN